jgi:hypothetical protein
MSRKIKPYCRNIFKIIFIIPLFLLKTGCRNDISSFSLTNQDAILEPDYTSVTIPPNIAPMNFRIKQPGDRFVARLYNQKGIEIKVKSISGDIEIPEKEWRILLSSAVPDKYFVDIFVKRSGV